ncbi:synaptotagmin-5 [Mastacembelus armatus]|uniref:C2 domain-containing protein n=1 Tax=Mastacembelus armatus TaxID=205130 RepID=A0A7N8XYK1_9TELE|nr:synaptotagmin-5-like [Mastacembelus armatus]XP_026166239.1 synaptotagmin-5-like [Mastacembelus armatus]
MVILMVYPAPVGLLSAAGELWMPFSDMVKYCILGMSVTLLLLALGILAWQTFMCCTQTYTTDTGQDAVNSDLLCLSERSGTTGNYSAAPSTKVEDVSTEDCRLSRCLSQASFLSESSQADGDMAVQANIEKVNGSLRLSIYHDQQQSRLMLTILQVEGLVKNSPTHSLKPFVKIRLMWTGSKRGEVESCRDKEGEGTPPALWAVLQEWQTRIVKGSCNPLFGDQFIYCLQKEKDLHHIILRMEVRDFDKFSRDEVLGEVRVSPDQLNTSYPVELHEDLQIPQKDLVGEVLLSLKLLPTSQRLEVGLLKIRTILTGVRSDAALYARISVQCNQCKLRYQKTSAVARCHVTVFNEVLMFSLPEFPLEQCKIMVSVYEIYKTKKSAKYMIGQFTITKEKSSEDKHWSLMMHSVRQPIAQWHGLLL